MKPEIMWAIVGKYGLYCGTWLRRCDAINQHCKDKGASWGACRKRGDRAVKVRVSLANAALSGGVAVRSKGIVGNLDSGETHD